MSANLTQPRTEFNEEEHLHYRDVVRTLTGMAMEMAAGVLEASKAPPEPGTPQPDHTARFERISRTVRRCVLLARKLAEPLPQPRLLRDAAASPPLDRTAARKRIIRGVEDAIDLARRTKGVDVERLEAELLDRLDRPDIEADLATRPIEHIIADLARDLGVGNPLDEKFFVWKRRTPEDIETLEARAAEPLPTEPGPPRTATRAPPPKERKLPDDPAAAVAMVLALGKVRDG